MKCRVDPVGTRCITCIICSIVLAIVLVRTGSIVRASSLLHPGQNPLPLGRARVNPTCHEEGAVSST